MECGENRLKTAVHPVIDDPLQGRAFEDLWEVHGLQRCRWRIGVTRALSRTVDAPCPAEGGVIFGQVREEPEQILLHWRPIRWSHHPPAQREILKIDCAHTSNGLPQRITLQRHWFLDLENCITCKSPLVVSLCIWLCRPHIIS